MSRIEPKAMREYSLWVRLFFFFQKKKYGAVLEPMLLWGRTPRVMRCFLSVVRALSRRNSPLDPELRALVCIKVSQINVCAFCVDMNSALLLRHGGTQGKLNELQDFETSLTFNKKEKTVLKYVDAITKSNQKIDETAFRELKTFFNDNEIIELTALIAFQNMSSKFNAALNATSFGFCQISKK